MTEALFGLLGVLIGAIIPWVREAWVERRRRTNRARYLAIRVVCTLDRFVETCVEIVQDDGLAFGQRDQDGCLRPQVSLPDRLEYPDDVDWQSIRHELMYDLLSLPEWVVRSNRTIQFIANEIAAPPDYDEAFEAQHEEYATLGIQAFELAATLRRTYGLPERTKDGWDPLTYLKQEKRKIGDQRQEADRRHAEFWASTEDRASLPESAS